MHALFWIRQTFSLAATYSPQFASSLDSAAWVPAASHLIQVTDMNNGWERCVVEDTQTVPAAATRFARVAVSW